MILQGPVLLCPLPHSKYLSILPFGRSSERYDPTGSGTVVRLPAHVILLFSPAVTRL